MENIYIFDFLRNVVPNWLWNLIWYLAPVSAILMMPLGSFLLYLLMYLGLEEAPRLTQLNILLSPIYGIFGAIFVLLFVGKARLSQINTRIIRILAMMSLIAAPVTTAILFVFYSK